MSDQKDHYNVLEINRGANPEAIRNAHRRLARKFHPDLNKDENAAARFNEIQAAYDVLSDTEKRSRYDRYGHAGAAGQAPGQSGPGPWQNVTPDDFESIFGESFGGRSRRSGGMDAERPTGPSKGRDLEHVLEVGFAAAAFGGTETIRIGKPDGTPTSIDVRIPAGVQTGSTLRIRDKGLPGSNGGPSGDLLLQIKVGRHPWFTRVGLDLSLVVPITVTEAILGGEITVPLMKGTATLKVPPGVRSGAKLRLKGKGVVDSKERAGDLYAVLEIVAPKADDLSEDDRKALESIACNLPNPRSLVSWAGEIPDV
ncbi:MAG: DnaJ domain-containing protein [Planctomycetota bacterium]|nr:DnaJ domain-containing protein [Planctomycetota bacterium]